MSKKKKTIKELQEERDKLIALIAKLDADIAEADKYLREADGT
jgi:hypothetical protein